MPNLPSTLPASRVPSPREAPALRWGILAPGGIATKFVTALQAHTDQRVVAAGSRSQERAEAFRQRFQLDRAYGSYEALVEDKEVDAVYIAATNQAHLPLALLAIEHGKHLLIEKPLTCTAPEGRRIAEAARARGVLCMEAMWTRYLPHTDVLRQVLDAGIIGDIRFLAADHSQQLPVGGRAYQPDLGGGALLDLGVYPVAFAYSVLGRPDRVRAHGTLTENGLDAQSVLTFEYASGALAGITTSMIARLPTGAAIGGSDAMIQTSEPFYRPGAFTISQSERQGGASVSWKDETGITGSDGLCYQAVALARYAAEGRTESPLLGLDESISIMETLDDARHQVGAYLPGEARD